MKISRDRFRRHEKMLNPALFLDRDGIINEDKGYVHKISDFIFKEGIFQVVKKANDNNYHVVVITNQSGIGRGIFTLDDYRKLTGWMLDKFEEKKCKIDLVLESRLDPNSLNPSDFEDFRRKPNPGMILEAAEILNIDLENSILVGDQERDVMAGHSAGIRKLFLLNKESLLAEVISFNSLGELSLRDDFLVSWGGAK
jgi:D-glycero-D-manno-heptose 1,7-bisphosphate phosphatase